MRRPAVRTVLLLAAVATLGACSSGDDYAVRDAQPCPVAEQLGTAIDELDAVLAEDEATADDVEEARARVAGAIERLDDAAEEIAPDEADALDAAWEPVDDELEGIDGDAAVAGAASGAQGGLGDVRTARDDLAEALSC